MDDKLGLSDELSIAMGRPRTFVEQLAVSGELLLELYGPDGTLKQVQRVPNLVVDAGENHIADQLASSPAQSAMSHMALGTGSTAAAFGDTALGAETDRNALTSRTTSVNVVTYVGTWAAGDGTNSALREAGIFNNSSGGTMLARAVYTLIDKQAADTLTVTWTITIGVAGA